MLTPASTQVSASPADLEQSLADAVSGAAFAELDPAPGSLIGDRESSDTQAPVDPAGSADEAVASGAKPIVTALTVAADAGVGRRRTQVILHLLREAGIIQRTRRGYALKSKHAPAAEALQAMLTTYSDRAASDKNRLSGMMHYAETPSCRAQVIRSYFDEPAGEPCGRCDNCAGANAASVAETAASAAAPEAAELAAPMHREQVHTVETMHGSYQTTRQPASQAAAQTTAPGFQPGDQVNHRKFGPGKVLDVFDDTLLIDFVKAGSKRLRADFVAAA